MAFEFEKFSSIRIFVENISESREWYKKLFKIDPFENSDDFVSFRICDVSFDICLADDQSPKSTGGAVGYWLIDNMDELISDVRNLGAVIYRGPLYVKETQTNIIQIQDPFGNIIGFEAVA